MIGIFDILPKPYEWRSDDRLMTDSRLIVTHNFPKYAWEMRIGGQSGLVVRIEEGKEPNFFHRVMQELVLGIAWRKL